MSRADGPGFRVVDIAAVGRYVTAREAAEQIPHSHELGQLGRWPVARLRFDAGHSDRLYGRAVSDGLGQ